MRTPRGRCGCTGVTSTLTERAPAVAAIGTMAIAAIAWVAVVWQTAMAPDMGMSPTSLPSFAVNWIAIMAAMMLPSAAPFVMAFVRGLEGSRSWPVGVGVLLAVYLFVWACFGASAFLRYERGRGALGSRPRRRTRDRLRRPVRAHAIETSRPGSLLGDVSTADPTRGRRSPSGGRSR